MWPDALRLWACTALVLSSCMLAQPQILDAPRSLDPVTQRTLTDLNRLLMSSNNMEAIEVQVMNVVNSSGYIRELAPVYYRMASRDTNLARVARFYVTVIEQWPESAWAQKALIALVPLIDMSEGDLGRANERTLWEHRDDLLNASDDAASIGESPTQLQTEVWKQMVRFAHRMNDAGQLDTLLALEMNLPTETRAAAQLARTSIDMRSGPAPQAAEWLSAWIAAHGSSPYLPYAMLLQYEAETNPARMADLSRQLRNRFGHTLEAQQLNRLRTLGGF